MENEEWAIRSPGAKRRMEQMIFHRKIIIKSAGFARAFDTPTQRPWDAAFG